jgi:hypothetical protein
MAIAWVTSSNGHSVIFKVTYEYFTKQINLVKNDVTKYQMHKFPSQQYLRKSKQAWVLAYTAFDVKLLEFSPQRLGFISRSP